MVDDVGTGKSRNDSSQVIELSGTPVHAGAECIRIQATAPLCANASPERAERVTKMSSEEPTSSKNRDLEARELDVHVRSGRALCLNNQARTREGGNAGTLSSRPENNAS